MKTEILICIVALLCMLIPAPSVYAASKAMTEPQNRITDQNIIQPLNAAVNYYRFFKNAESIDYKGGTPKVVSSDMTGPATISLIYSRTFTSTFSTSLAASNSTLIQGTVSASCSTSITNSVAYTSEIEKGLTGHVMFRPYLVYVQGALKYYSSQYPNTPISTKQVSAKYVKKLDGFAHGHFYPVYI